MVENRALYSGKTIATKIRDVHGKELQRSFDRPPLRQISCVGQCADPRPSAFIGADKASAADGKTDFIVLRCDRGAASSRQEESGYKQSEDNTSKRSLTEPNGWATPRCRNSRTLGSPGRRPGKCLHGHRRDEHEEFKQPFHFQRSFLP